MISGEVTPQREAVIPLEIRGLISSRVVEAVIDTGFNDFLALSSELIEDLGLKFETPLLATLADGNTIETSSYRATVVWDDESREILVISCDGGPLIGMSLIYGYDLKIEVVDCGLVTIEKRR